MTESDREQIRKALYVTIVVASAPFVLFYLITL
jgi:hypothetical protein